MQAKCRLLVVRVVPVQVPEALHGADERFKLSGFWVGFCIWGASGFMLLVDVEGLLLVGVCPPPALAVALAVAPDSGMPNQWALLLALAVDMALLMVSEWAFVPAYASTSCFLAKEKCFLFFLATLECSRLDTVGRTWWGLCAFLSERWCFLCPMSLLWADTIALCKVLSRGFSGVSCCVCGSCVCVCVHLWCMLCSFYC